MACAMSLVEAGASIDGSENLMAYPIHVAAGYNSHDLLAWLLTLGKNHTLLDHRRWSLLHHVAHSADSKTMQILEKAHLFGLEPELKASNGKTPREIFDGPRKENLNENPEVYESARLAFDALIASLSLSHGSVNTSPKSVKSIDEVWYDALDKMELGDMPTFSRAATLRDH
ncbi:hypothetical protein NQ176_g10019 [Zarea fungicola]|uniref:Uncharacterized protein n=1 Tax=Zarea fungicola TaxID=93591 RepID=A0ACC1MKB4_9HYPO|nr:hypothetical protein NQ176_g10019 [Lecanicillium fungicola]